MKKGQEKIYRQASEGTMRRKGEKAKGIMGASASALTLTLISATGGIRLSNIKWNYI